MIRKAKNKFKLPLKKKDIIGLDSDHLYSRKLVNSIDFLCRVGTPIFAAASGKIVWLKDNSKFGGKDRKKFWNLGNRIVISHRFGEYTAYEHLKYKVYHLHSYKQLSIYLNKGL